MYSFLFVTRFIHICCMDIGYYRVEITIFLFCLFYGYIFLLHFFYYYFCFSSASPYIQRFYWYIGISHYTCVRTKKALFISILEVYEGNTHWNINHRNGSMANVLSGTNNCSTKISKYIENICER